MLQTLRQETRPALSEVAKTASLPAGVRRSDLDADLDAIARRAVACDPMLRYSAVVELDADLRRWLNNLPVAARKAGRRYRIGRFIRRHRLGLGLTVAVFVALVAVGGGGAPGQPGARAARRGRGHGRPAARADAAGRSQCRPGHQMGAHALLRTTLARVEADTPPSHATASPCSAPGRGPAGLRAP